MSDDAFGWYFTGLVDGEGCFIAWAQGAGVPNFHSSFFLEMRDDERPGIEAIALRFGVGSLQTINPPSRRGNPSLRWIVSRKSELVERVIPHFERFPLRLKKARDFEVWREFVLAHHKTMLRPLVGAGRSRITPEEQEHLLDCMRRLKAGRAYLLGGTVASESRT